MKDIITKVGDLFWFLIRAFWRASIKDLLSLHAMILWKKSFIFVEIFPRDVIYELQHVSMFKDYKDITKHRSPNVGEDD